MRLTTLLCLAVALLPVALCAGTDSRNGHRAGIDGHDAYHPPASQNGNYRLHAPYDRSGYQATVQGYQLASSGKRWEDMNPREQEQIRRRKERYESLPSDDKQRIREARERYERMPPERKEKIRERWERMPADKKERYRLERRER